MCDVVLPSALFNPRTSGGCPPIATQCASTASISQACSPHVADTGRDHLAGPYRGYLELHSGYCAAPVERSVRSRLHFTDGYCYRPGMSVRSPVVLPLAT